MIVLTSVDAVVEHLGGVAAVAVLTRRTKPNIYNWKNANRIAAAHYVVMTRALVRRGACAPPSLWGIEEERDAA
jgi:hypothetical protein